MGSRILLADDSITIQKVVNLTFADEGIDVVAVSSGDLAERRLGEIKPDLVLADIFMPGKNGYELCEAIKENAEFRDVPVVLLVGAFEPFDQVEARRVRADAHLTKPFESRTLVETVRRLMNSGSPTSASPIAPASMRDEPGEETRAVSDASPLSAAASMPPVKLDLTAMMLDPDDLGAQPPARATDELASPALEAQSDIFEVPIGDSPAGETVDLPLNDEKDPFGAELATGVTGAGARSMFGSEPQEMILDFDKSETFEPQTSTQAEALEMDEGDMLDVAVSESSEAPPWFDTVRETPSLEMPSAGNEWQPVASTAPLSQQAADLALRNAPEASTETAAATLLAVEEPLGDVLLDAGVSHDPLPAIDISSDDSLEMELIEQRIVETPSMSADTEFALVDGGAQQMAAQPFEFQQQPGTDAFEAAEVIAGSNGNPISADAGALNNSQAGATRGEFEWTSPLAGAYSTSQLDSVVMPINPAEYAAVDTSNLDALTDENTARTDFATGTTWTEEETRFAAIDIEAAHIEDSQAVRDTATTADKGFAFSSATEEPPAAKVESPAVGAAAPNSEYRPATELSSAAVEEIVRRVVAEMSDSVVREIAWEVVPDCVERVIAQLARESLSKQT